MKKFLGLPFWVLAAGLTLGIAVGSYRQFGNEEHGSAGSMGQSVVSDRNGGGPGNEDRHWAGKSEPAGESTDSSGATPTQRDVQFRAGEGVVFEPAVIAGQFVGYRVISNRHDPRFQVGDILTGVGGYPVEDSAAGSELFVAALSNSSAEIAIYRRSDDLQ